MTVHRGIVNLSNLFYLMTYYVALRSYAFLLAYRFTFFHGMISWLLRHWERCCVEQKQIISTRISTFTDFSPQGSVRNRAGDRIIRGRELSVRFHVWFPEGLVVRHFWLVIWIAPEP